MDSPQYASPETSPEDRGWHSCRSVQPKVLQRMWRVRFRALFEWIPKLG